MVRALRQMALPSVSSLHTLPRACAPDASFMNRRHYATPPPQVSNNTNISVEQYHALSDTTMETMLESLENVLDEEASSEYEVDYSSGVLTLKLGQHGTYVINKQPPNKQIWLSSPTSGPKRYDYVPERDQWVYLREGRTLGQLLNEELSKIFNREIDLKIDKVSDCV